METNFIGNDFGPLFHYQFRLIIIGDSSVGKSSLLTYFTEGRAAPISDPTVGVDFYARMIELETGYRVRLNIWDTAGQEAFRAITRSYYRNAAGVVLAFDITKRQTFEHVVDWIEEAEMNLGGPNPKNCVFQLVGHKSDSSLKREVLYEEGEYLARYHRMRYLETSAVTGENVFECFSQIAADIDERVRSGKLTLQDGWDGVRKGQMRTTIDAQSICLSERSRFGDDDPNGQPSCSC